MSAHLMKHLELFFKKKSSSTEKSNITLHFACPSLLNNFNMYLNDK